MHRSTGQRDVLSVLAAQVLLLLASIVTQAALAWLLRPDGRGLYALFAAFATILPVVFTLGLDRSIQFHLMSGKMGLAEALRALLKVWAVAAACGGAAALLLGGRTGLPSPWQDTALWLAGLTLLATASLYSVLLKMRVAARQFGGYLAATLAQSAANLAILGVLALTGLLRPAAAIVALAVSYGVAAFLSWRALLGASQAYDRAARRDHAAGQVFRYGIRYYPALVGHAVDFNAGTLVLAAVATTQDVGIFAAIAALMLKFLMVAQAFQESMLPRIAADNRGRAELVAQLARIAIAATFVAGLLFAVVSRPILALLLSPEFASGAGLVWWALPGIAVHAGSTLLMPYFEGTGRPGIVSIAVWCGLAVNVLVILLAFPFMGLDSAGLAMTSGMVARFLVLAVPFSSVTGLPLTSLFGVREVDWLMLRGLALRSRKTSG